MMTSELDAHVGRFVAEHAERVCFAEFFTPAQIVVRVDDTLRGADAVPDAQRVAAEVGDAVSRGARLSWVSLDAGAPTRYGSCRRCVRISMDDDTCTVMLTELDHGFPAAEQVHRTSDAMEFARLMREALAWVDGHEPPAPLVDPMAFFATSVQSFCTMVALAHHGVVGTLNRSTDGRLVFDQQAVDRAVELSARMSDTDDTAVHQRLMRQVVEVLNEPVESTPVGAGVLVDAWLRPGHEGASVRGMVACHGDRSVTLGAAVVAQPLRLTVSSPHMHLMLDSVPVSIGSDGQCISSLVPVCQHMGQWLDGTRSLGSVLGNAPLAC